MEQLKKAVSPSEEVETPQQPEQQATTSKKVAPEEVFNHLTTLFESEMDKFEEGIKDFGKNALARNFLIALEHPLRQTRKVTNQKEMDLTTSALRIAECKYNMYLNYTINEDPERLFEHLLTSNIGNFKAALDKHILERTTQETDNE